MTPEDGGSFTVKHIDAIKLLFESIATDEDELKVFFWERIQACVRSSGQFAAGLAAAGLKL